MSILWRNLATGLLIVSASMIQSTNFLVVGGAKPNLVLAALAVLAILNWPLIEYLTWMLVAAILLKFSPILSWISVVFLITAVKMFFINRFLPWSRYLSGIVVIISGTAVFYILGAPIFLYHQWPTVLLELVYNVVVGVILIMIWPKKD
ncbi:MAG: hypothetical protein Q8O87_04300 [bacterium]|nr:hypothetical protein [bacterium]